MKKCLNSIRLRLFQIYLIQNALAYAFSECYKKEKEETSFEISSMVYLCGGITDYRTFMEDFRKCAEFVKWLKEKTEG